MEFNVSRESVLDGYVTKNEDEGLVFMLADTYSENEYEILVIHTDGTYEINQSFLDDLGLREV